MRTELKTGIVGKEWIKFKLGWSLLELWKYDGQMENINIFRKCALFNSITNCKFLSKFKLKNLIEK